MVASGDCFGGEAPTPRAAMSRAAIFGSREIAIVAPVREQPRPGRVLRHRRAVASSIYTSDSAALRADTRYVSPAVR